MSRTRSPGVIDSRSSTTASVGVTMVGSVAIASLGREATTVRAGPM